MYLTFTNHNIEIYFKEIKKNDNLTREDEITLFGRIARGDKQAETIVFNKMAKMAVAIAKTYTGSPELLEDLIQEANMGILTAIKKYDPSMGYRFSSYARWWMKANINVFLNNLGIVHPCASRTLDLAKKIREQFYKENHRDITEIELMEKLEDMGEIVTDVTSILDISISSIDDVVDDDDNTASDYGAFATATASHNEYEDEIENDDLSYEITKRLSKLSEREQMFIRMKFGFITGIEMDDYSISQKWNKMHPEKTLTQERVRQIIKEALIKMK